ncbi:MAG: PaaI family thioesterase [Lachnospiraceae bacterium]|jgi:acyl-CoA thioesterase|nr:PaaI family thioesterase [Lachnospiraceae bacterium]
MTDINEIRKFFENDRFATENGMVIDSVGDKTAICSLTVDKRHMNAVGNVMGGVYFTLADFTFAVATNHDEPGIVSLSSTITFNAIARGEKIICEAKQIKWGKTTCVYEMSLTDEKGNLLATVLTTGYNTRK